MINIFDGRRSLRSGYGGQLRMNPVLRPYGLMDLLPAKTDIPDEGCTHRAENGNKFCFDGGNIIIENQLLFKIYNKQFL